MAERKRKERKARAKGSSSYSVQALPPVLLRPLANTISESKRRCCHCLGSLGQYGHTHISFSRNSPYGTHICMFAGELAILICFGVRVSVMFHSMFVHYTFSSVWVLNLNSLLVKRQIGNPSPGAVTGGN